MKIKIALCQLLPEADNPEKNFTVIENTVKDCANQNVELCVFPEDFLYGVLRDGDELLDASKQFPYWVDGFSKLAKKHKVDLIPGSFPSYNKGKVFNSTVYINFEGKILSTYSKSNLWLAERKKYSSSLKGLNVFNSIIGKTAILICWDIFDHKLFEDAVEQEVEWIIIPAFWSVNQSEDALLERGKVESKYSPIFDTKIIDSLIQARVIEFNIGIIFCNFGGNHVYIGNNGLPQKAISANRTQVATPFNYLYKRLANRKERVLIVDIPPITQQIKDFEIYYGRREDIVNDYPAR